MESCFGEHLESSRCSSRAIVGLAERVLEAVNLVQPGQVVRIAG